VGDLPGDVSFSCDDGNDDSGGGRGPSEKRRVEKARIAEACAKINYSTLSAKSDTLSDSSSICNK
jgi:hypothetical protein